jgi:uncharacterized membrane protein YfcA
MNIAVVIPLLFVLGAVAGFINVMAGGGSSITLPMLIFLGLDSALANGTNRLAIFSQNISAVISFRQEKFSDFKTSLRLTLLTLPGAIIGTIVAVRIDNMLFQKILGVVLIGVMVTILLPNAKKGIATVQSRDSWIIYPVMFGIGFYGGFIQVGVGFMLMASLSHILRMDLVRVNMHKVFIVFLYTLPTLVVFAITGNINWLLGFSLAAGNALGAWWSAKISISGGEKVIRLVLVISMFVMAIKLLKVF